MQSGFLIVILPREPQVILDAAVRVDTRFTERRVSRTPDDRPIAPDQPLRRPQVIVLVVVHLIVSRPLEQRVRHPRLLRVEVVFLQQIAAAVVIRRQSLVVVQIPDGGRGAIGVGGLFDPHPVGVVGILTHGGAVDPDRNQPLFMVVHVLGGGAVVGFGGGVAVGVVGVADRSASVTGGLGQLVLVVVDQSDVSAVSRWIGIITFAGFALAFFTIALLVNRQVAGVFHPRMPGAVAHPVVGKDLVVRGGVQRVVGVRQPVEVVVIEAVHTLLAGDPLDVVFPVVFVERTGHVVVGRVFQDAFFHLQEVVVAQGDLRPA